MSLSNAEQAFQPLTKLARKQISPSALDFTKAHEHVVLGIPQSEEFDVLEKSLTNMKVAFTENRSFSIPENQEGIENLRYGSIQITEDAQTSSEPETGDDKSWGCMVRLLKFDGIKWIVSQTGLVNAVSDSKTIGDVSVIDLVFKASPQLQVLEIRKPQGESTYLVLPLPESGMPEQTIVKLWDNGAGFHVDCEFIESPRAGMVLKYLGQGALDFAANMAGQAEEILYQKIQNPVEAAIGGYVLLRIGDLSRLHEWPSNLCNWFAALADGAIIDGELAARKGNHEKAIELFIKACERGLPMFSEGLSILVTRLRAYLMDKNNRQLTAEQRKRLEQAYELFASIALYQNEGSELLSFSSVDLVDEDKKHLGWQFIVPSQFKQQGVSISQFPVFFEGE